ncbi:hypothetical protein SEVIR_7G081800v4 [Setaria viridis]|uniref:HMA domain-containing protein n=2 Tax=Setaria viridis TaxID=4556 RepID=A0A4U6TN18_SETVI|nr:heavy metal-associated isoprenylated plant protein 7-like [Setaria viridis]TKW04020.1 hypothetical protein SEVIR_7G081800v2 [Setaria viridis]
MGEEVRKEEVEKPKAGVEEKPKDAVAEAKLKDGEEKKEEAPPPPPEEVEMRVYMHCKGCALKVKKILKRFNGVEGVIADSKTHKVVVKGKKVAADPAKVIEHVHKKTGHKVELLSPIPPPVEEKKEEERKEELEPPKPEEKEEPPVIQVVLKVHIHCEVCAQWIRKRILKMKGVQSAELDLKASEVTVKGVLEEAKLAKYMYKRIGKHVSIIKSEPVAPLESPGGDAMVKEEKKVEGVEEKEEGDSNTGGEEDKMDKEMDAAAIATANLYMYYPQFAFPGGYYSPPTLLPPGYIYQAAYPPPSYTAYAPHHQMMAPQTFSDENPNACSII